MANSSELPFTAPPMTATMAMTMVAIDASRRTTRRMAIAAVGQEERQGRATGGDLEGEGRSDDQQADQDQDVVAVPERRPEPPDPGEQHHHHQDGEEQPAAEARDVGEVSRRPSSSIFSMSVAMSGATHSGRSPRPGGS